MEYSEAIIETTGTVSTSKDETFTYLPHTYYLNKAGKLQGYKSCLTGETKWFSKPLAFYKTRRKFKKA